MNRPLYVSNTNTNRGSMCWIRSVPTTLFLVVVTYNAIYFSVSPLWVDKFSALCGPYRRLCRFRRSGPVAEAGGQIHALGSLGVRDSYSRAYTFFLFSETRTIHVGRTTQLLQHFVERKQKGEERLRTPPLGTRVDCNNEEALGARSTTVKVRHCHSTTVKVRHCHSQSQSSRSGHGWRSTSAAPPAR